jgi:hypothetical protein
MALGNVLIADVEPARHSNVESRKVGQARPDPGLAFATSNQAIEALKATHRNALV